MSGFNVPEDVSMEPTLETCTSTTFIKPSGKEVQDKITDRQAEFSPKVRIIYTITSQG